MPNGKWEISIQFKYILSARFLHNIICWLVFFFLSNRLEPLYAVFISTPSDIPGTPCHPVFHSIKNPKFYLYLIRNNFQFLLFYWCKIKNQPRALADLPLGKIQRNPLNMRLGDSHNRSGPFKEREVFSSCRELNNVFSVLRQQPYPYTNWAIQVIIN